MKYAGKKLLSMLIAILAASFLFFLVFDIIPGDPAIAKLGTNATPERLESLREEMGLNRPFLVRYFSWLADFIRGDFGISYSYNIPVSSMILDKLPISITMTVMSFGMVLIISMPLGLFCARFEGKKLDTAICAVGQIMMSVPPFFSGLLITLLFGIILGLFTPGGFVSYDKSVTGFISALFFLHFQLRFPKQPCLLSC